MKIESEQVGQEIPKGVMFVIGAIFMMMTLGGLFMVIGISGEERQREASLANSQLQTEGIVTKKERTSKYSSVTNMVPYLSYTYTVGGSKQRGFWGVSDRFYSKIKVGDKVKVKYDPKDVTQSKLLEN